MNKWMKTYWKNRKIVFEYFAHPLFKIKNKLEYEFNFAKKIKDYSTMVLLEPESIQFIENPSEEVQLLAIKSGGFSIIRFIENPSEEVQLAVVNKHGYLIEDIKNPTEKVKLAAVNNFGGSIQYIENPSERVQWLAVRQNGEYIQHIKNPSPRVIELARSQGYDREGNRI